MRFARADARKLAVLSADIVGAGARMSGGGGGGGGGGIIAATLALLFSASCRLDKAAECPIFSYV